MSKGSGGFLPGAIFGVAVGTVIGLLVAPRSGEETRAMLTDRAYDLRDKALDTYSQGVSYLQDRFDEYKPYVEETAQDLRRKLDLARERMDAIRSNLSTQVTAAAGDVHKAVDDLKAVKTTAPAKPRTAAKSTAKRTTAATKSRATKPTAKKTTTRKK